MLYGECFLPKLQQPDEDVEHYTITVPNDLRKAMGWEKGDELEFTVKNSKSLEVSKKQ